MHFVLPTNYTQVPPFSKNHTRIQGDALPPYQLEELCSTSSEPMTKQRSRFLTPKKDRLVVVFVSEFLTHLCIYIHIFEFWRDLFSLNREMKSCGCAEMMFNEPNCILSSCKDTFRCINRVPSNRCG